MLQIGAYNVCVGGDMFCSSRSLAFETPFEIELWTTKPSRVFFILIAFLH